LVSVIDAEVIEEHVEEAAFLWSYRDGAIEGHAFDLPRIEELDGRIEAHLDGLRLDLGAGWDACRDALQGERGDAGVVFVAALLAVERQDARGFAQVLDVAAGSAKLSRGVVSGLGWAAYADVQRLLPGLVSERSQPELRTLGLAGCAAHRRDPGPVLGYALGSSDPRLKARALRAAGELGRADLLPEVQREVGAQDPECRFWASWSAGLLDGKSSLEPLWDFAVASGPRAARAAQLALRRLDPKLARSWFQSMIGGARDARVALAGAVALGDPDVVPWIIACMSNTETARGAAAALALITGVDLEAERLVRAPPADAPAGPSDDPDDDDVAMDPDDGLPWPDPDAVRAWWVRDAPRFARGTRHLLGKPVGPGWLSEVLADGRQPARAAAALELSLAEPGQPLFEVRAPAARQRSALRERR
jgi:uncharacterized protein (TIGR02270 family)